MSDKRDAKLEILRQIEQKGIADNGKIPAIRKLATTCRISTATVHRVIASLVAEGMLETRPGSGTYLVRKSATALTNCIGVLVPIPSHSIESSFFNARLIHGIESVLNQEGCQGVYVYVMENTPVANEELLLTRMEAMNVDGIIANFFATDHSPVWAKLKTFAKPVVLLNNTPSGNLFDAVLCNNILGGQMACDYLLTQNATSFFIVADQQNVSSVRERIRGFCDRAMSAGIPDSQITLSAVDITPTEEQFDQWSQALAQCARTEPVGVFCINDYLAREIRIRLDRLDRLDLPQADRIRIVGFNGNEYPDMQGKFVSVFQCAETMGMRAAKLLMERLHTPDRREFVEVRVNPEIRL